MRAVAEARMIEMADHHRVEQPVLGERPVGLELDLPPGLGDIGERLVAVDMARAVAREVLGHGDDIGVAMRGDEGARQRGDGIGIGAEASVALADHRIAGIEVEIDDRAEIEIEAGIGELLRHGRVELLGAVGEAKLGFLPTLRAEGK